MIYELHNKIPKNSSYLYSEDVLTSTVFGNLRYFSTLNILSEFLSSSESVDNEQFQIQLDAEDTIKFWCKYSSKKQNQINEPDIVIENSTAIIIVECKYYSKLDEDFGDTEDNYTNQLIRYSSIVEDYYNSKSTKVIVLLTNDKIKPKDIMNTTIKKINKNIKLYWLSWYSLYNILIKYTKKNEIRIGEIKLLDDLKYFLKKRSLINFNGFTLCSVEKPWSYNNKSNYDFSTIQKIFTKWSYI